MDLEPIYCAEQIVIPADLGDVLKNYTKEVVRRHPEDLLQFSAIYFANLAQISQSLEEVVPPTLEQVQEVHKALGQATMSEAAEMSAICVTAGITPATVDKVFQLGSFGGGLVEPHDFIVMLAAMIGDSLQTVLQNIFQVFGDEGGNIQTVDFLRLFGYLQSKDSEIPAEAKDKLSNSLGIVESVSLAKVLADETVQGLLGA